MLTHYKQNKEIRLLAATKAKWAGGDSVYLYFKKQYLVSKQERREICVDVRDGIFLKTAFEKNDW